jgi:hypothetical protein
MIDSFIFMFRRANECFDIYPDILDAYFMYDYYMEKALFYKIRILELL